ncbi:Guanine nucleotide exchange factor for Cdc42p [Coemansia brasiliensis]|uniref:Guanine nucleotide exchange factor for Cdc42p n=1 Tax=Coemansia brasiliensis TaxID=2650707 RepID=A0A9W8M1E8_9FUNG|nr:Guanine nucleotide exchange factor for Cdc42p [Coemansia brasiliensis]
MPHVAGVFQGRLANLTLKFAAKLFSFCMGPRKRTIETYDNSSSTSRAVSVTRKAYVSPYERAITLLERLLSLPCIASIVHPLLIDEKAQATSFKDPTRPLRELFKRGCTLNILINELESPFVATIDLYECADNGRYEGHQIDLFWQGCVSAGLVSEAALSRIGDVYDVENDACLELMMAAVASILDQLQLRGQCGLPDSRYLQPRDIYPTAHVADGQPRFAVLAAELSRTEVAYVQDLERLVAYADSVGAQLDHFEVDLETIFGHIRGILDLHRKFSIRIQYLAAMPLHRQLLGAAYENLDFHVYSLFCAHRETSQRAFERALPVLKQLDIPVDPEFDIPSLFMRPVQRLAQYPILFQNIVDAMCESCASMAPAEQAERVQVVKSAYAAMHRSKLALTQANETTREAINETQQAQFLARIAGSECTAQRLGKLLVSGPVSAQTKRDFEPVEAYLFETTLVVCASNSTHGSRAARIRRTISSLHVSMKSPSMRRREDRRRSGDSTTSSTLNSPVLSAHSPSAESFRLPDIDAGCALSLNTAPQAPQTPSTPTPLAAYNLGSYASLNTLRESQQQKLKFAETTETDCAGRRAQLAVRAQIPTEAISQVSQLSEVDGSVQLTIQALLSDGTEATVVFRALSRETAGVWIRMLSRAVPLQSVEESVTQGNDNYILLVNPQYAPAVLGRKLVATAA